MSGLIADAPQHQAHQAAIPQRRAALIAGLAYVIITVLSFFAISVLDGPTEPNNPAATAGNIVNSVVLFRSGLAAFIIVLIADVVVAWALYVFFQRTSRELSLFAAWFRLLYVAIAAAALLNTLVVLKLVDGTGYSTALEKGQRDAQVMLSLDAYNYGFFLGLVFFGLHLLLLGFVMVKSELRPQHSRHPGGIGRARLCGDQSRACRAAQLPGPRRPSLAVSCSPGTPWGVRTDRLAAVEGWQSPACSLAETKFLIRSNLAGAL